MNHNIKYEADYKTIKKFKKALSEIHGYYAEQRDALEFAHILFNRELQRIKEINKEVNEL